MEASTDAQFKKNYQTHLQHLKLKGLRPKTIEAYSRAIRRIGERFDHQIDSLTEPQLTDYFTELVASHSWSTVKLDLYGLQFFYAHVLRKPWVAPGLIKPPKTQRLPDIVTIAQAKRIFAATRVLSYRVFFFILYSLGLRLGEGLRLQVGDIDAARWRVHIRDAKGNRDRFVPLSFRYRNAKTGKMERRTVFGAHFLWLVLQHVLPKGFRRARNFGFLHPNCKPLIALLHVLLKFAPGRALPWFKQRAPIVCTCYGAVMVIVKTRIRSVFSGVMPVPIATQGAH